MFFRTLACLPALTGAWAERGGGIAKSVGSYSDALIDVATFIRPDLGRIDGRPGPRTLNMSRLGDILTDPHAGCDDGPGRPRIGRVELEPARHRAQRRAGPPRPRT